MTQETENREKYILIAVDYGQDYAPDKSLDELAELLKTAGGEAVARVVQRLDSPIPGTYLGSGKIEELSAYIEGERAAGNRIDGVLSDDELSPAQMANLEQILGGKVLDRTSLILDIFALHAHTREGKIQVEMAQLSYRSSRLAGSFGQALSRQGGGIGTRGPGESKLETDRRAIRNRMARLRREIREMEKSRETGRKMRLQNGIPVVAIVGYTNAGKSTLLNRLTDSDVLEEDQLFATLDPTTRSARLKDGQKVLFTDTVGFIHKLPHQLVEAFHSTLEEASYADIILHVIDGSDPEWPMHRQVVYDTLDELDINGRPVITAFNKSDLLTDPLHGMDGRAERTVSISAKNGQGLDQLMDAISDVLREIRVLIDRTFSYQEGAKVNQIHRMGQVLSEDYSEDGIHIRAYVPRNLTNV
ncbi:MAG: GTPase HflX [Lachnospiraceae bacterium]|nr:GTPase HflX [Lachnospiraceae bacterium]